MTYRRLYKVTDEVKNFERAVQTFAGLWREFCCLIAQVLLFFAVLCKNFEVQYKSQLHFSRGGGVKAFQWTACCCQK